MISDRGIMHILCTWLILCSWLNTYTQITYARTNTVCCKYLMQASSVGPSMTRTG